jgi:Zn-dependent M28 family amino/carboxypeptidase
MPSTRRPTRPCLRSILVLPLVLTAACAERGARPEQAPPLPLPPGTDEARAVIDAELLREHVAALAENRMAGRAPGSPGDRLARAYLVEQLTELGLEPGAPGGSWEQSFEIVGITAEVPQSWTFDGPQGELTLQLRDDFIAASGVQSESATVEDAEVVFVGYGIVAPEYGWNDYEDANLAGKVLLVLNNDPDWDPELFEGNRRLYYGRWDYKYQSAADQGAAGAIIIHSTPSAGYPWQVVETSWTGEQFELPAGDEARVQIEAWTQWEAAERLASLAGLDLDELVERAKERSFEPVPLGVRTSLSLRNRIEHTETANVLGLLPGSDPQLGQEVVVYTAHHDHLGREQGEGDVIYNGALDNASGCAQILAIAEAMAGLPEAPRRSALFAFVGAEESGLLGSEYYARHPTFPPGRIAANVNFDGGNIWGRTRDVTYIGYGKSSLDEVVAAAAARQDRIVKPDQFPDRGFFYRSDQFNFAKIGVPAIYLDTGTDFRDRPAGWGKEQIEQWEAEHYHQTSDELTEEWDFSGMVEDARLGLICGLAIAQADELPHWSPGDEFAAARTEALAAVE